MQWRLTTLDRRTGRTVQLCRLGSALRAQRLSIVLVDSEDRKFWVSASALDVFEGRRTEAGAEDPGLLPEPPLPKSGGPGITYVV